MNYQHHYHAGSSADVFKHIMLLAMLDSFKQKSKPFCYIDLFAGSGRYDLTKSLTGEWQMGIGQLMEKTAKHPLINHYLALAKDLSRYPGSPLLAKKNLRDTDEMILVEKADMPYLNLKKLFSGSKQIHIHHTSAELAIKSLLPPAIRRSIILIDPPYEEKTALADLPAFLKNAVARFPTACYLVWYPIKARLAINYLHRQLKKKLSLPLLVTELCPWPDDVPLRLNGSGLVVINPPWLFENTAVALLKELCSLLQQHPKACHRVFSL